MKSGSLLASGTSEEIKKDINVKEHYLGEDFNF
jgi:lipopolysaccharide export system ATP-binding protein